MPSLRSALAIVLVSLGASPLRAETSEPSEGELAPYFAQGALKGALAELEAGRAARALQLLPQNPQEPPARWLRALALKAAGSSGAARKAFEQLAARGGPLADRALHLAALSAIDGGDGARADRLLAQVSLRYVDEDQVLLERARQLEKLRLGGPRTAESVEEVLEPIFTGKVRGDIAAAHLLAGDAQLAASAREKARAHWREAWLEHPLSPAADSARERERQLGPGEPIPQAKLLKRAETLLDAHRNREAREQISRLKLPSLCAGGCPGDRTPAAVLEAALSMLAPGGMPVEHQPTAEDVGRVPGDPADPLACRARFGQGRALRKERDYA